MGTSLTCLQVYMSEKQKADIRKVVTETIRQQILNQGYIETSPQKSEQYPDRELFVGPVGDSPWLTVFITNSNLREIAQKVSATIKSTVIYVSLIDSDVVHLRRYVSGQIIDDYCNDPHAYDLYGIDPDSLSDWNETEEDSLKAMTRGNPANWRDLFVAGINPDEIREIWDSERVFADDILWATVAALGMNDEEIVSDFWAGQGRENFTRLTFQLKEKPLYETKAEEPPKLSLASYMEPGEVYVGHQLDLQISVQNEGSAFVGLDILAWGSALDKEIMHLDKAEVFKADDFEKKKEIVFIPARGKVETQEVPLLVATMTAFEFPQGVAGGLGLWSGGNWEKVMRAMAQTQVQFHIPALIKNTGVGELFIAFVPHTNRENGQVVFQASLTALSMPRRPLPSKDAIQPVTPQSLQLLESPDALFGLVSLGLERKQSAEIVANVIEEWIAKITSTNSDKFDAYLRARLDLKPKKKRLSAAAIPATSQWKELREGIKDCVSFSIHHKNASIIYDVSALFFQASGEEPAPQLMFYFPLSAFGEEEQNNINEWLLDMVNRLMTEASGLQAMVGKWGWRMAPTSLDMTLYETACNIMGQCTTGRFWCQRFLRGVTSNLWLGPDLLAHLRDRDQLDSVATIASYGEGISVTLNEGVTLDELEAALDSLLPREMDWRNGMDRLYPRKS